MGGNSNKRRKAIMACHSTKKRKTMAGQTSHEASSSSSSHRGWGYDAFLSFRGEDTRRTFTDHLYIALKGSGINVFRDDNELPVGENISTQLLEAIEASRISVIVFSRDYAASSWCLDELVKIMECKKSVEQVVVLPVFYHVDPSDVRKQRGSFAEPFSIYKERFTDDKMSRWEDALTDAANLKGFHCTADRHEGEFIKEIVEEIRKHVRNAYLHVAKYPVGLDFHVQILDSLSCDRSNDVCIIGICAMGGMGKTTIAKALYNHFLPCFDYKGFLDVKESSKNGHVHLQNKLLNEIFKSPPVGNVHEGINVIEDRLNYTKVLMVLDDVDHSEQLSTLAIRREREWFAPGSRIIITTRDEHLLAEVEVDYLYMVEELNDDDSLELFSWHAFSTSQPKEDYVGLTKEVLRYCKGLPLALTVLGSFLFERKASFWEDALKKLKRIPNQEIQNKLKISYDVLDRTEQAIFLDVACFFIGVDKDYAHAILEGCELYPEVGISTLISRCLLTINECNKLMMHDLLRDMGREIIRKKADNKLGHCSRLWFYEDVLDVLKKHKGTEVVEGLVLKLSPLNKEDLSTKAFAKMCNLRLLQLDYVRLNGSYNHFSKELRWICWHGFPLKFIPNNFHVENLVAIDMQHSKLREVWKEIKVLGKLKELNLSHSHYLIKTPNFSLAPNLKKLELEDCTSLVEVHPSIGDLDRLVLLNMKGCKKLKNLPERICALKTLEILNLSGCSMFEKLPKDLGEMESIIELLADETAIREVPASVVRLKNLKNLSLCGCTGMTSSSFASVFRSWVSRGKYQNSISLLPPSLQGLSSLTRLGLKGCNLFDEAIPKDLGNLSSLEYLDLSGNHFRSLPASISNLPKLERLALNFCTRLESLPELPAGLKNLYATNCNNLYSLPASISNLPMLNSLYLDQCTRLVSLPDLPTSLSELFAGDCMSLERLPNVSRLPHNADLHVTNCPKLSVIAGLEELKHGLNIHVQGCNRNLASTLKETLIQNPGEINLIGNEITSRFRHQSTGASVSLEVPWHLRNKDAVLDVCIVFEVNDPKGIDFMFVTHVADFLPSTGADKLDVVVIPSPLIQANVKKCGVHLYHRSQRNIRIQSGGDDFILNNSASNKDTMFVDDDDDRALPGKSRLRFSKRVRRGFFFEIEITAEGDQLGDMNCDPLINFLETSPAS